MSTRSVLLPLGGAAIRIRVEGEAARAGLLETLGARAARAGKDAELSMSYDGTRGELREGGTLVKRSASLADLLLHTEWRATTLAMERLRTRALLLHAAWVARGRRGVLIAGAHGRGKTTLAAALVLRHGWRLFGDDMLAADPRGGIRPLERPLRLKPGILRVLPELGRLGLDLAPWRRGEAVLAPIRLVSSKKGPTPVLGGIVLLGPRGTGAARVERVEPGRAVGALAPFAFNFLEEPRRALGILAGLAGQAPAWKISGGSLEERCLALGRLV